TTIPIFLFGLSEFSVRFISAIAGLLSIGIVVKYLYIGGLLSIGVLYLLTKKLFNDKIAIFSSLMFAIMPWAIGLSRVGIESNLAIFFALLALFFGFKNSEEKRRRNLSISAILLGISVYTYSAYLLFAPLFLLIICFENFYKTKFKIKNVIFPFLIFILIIAPVLINKSSASIRLSQVGLTTNVNSVGLLDNLNMQRGSCLESFPSAICKVINNKPLVFASTFVKNYVSHFSVGFLYINGNPTQYSILENRGVDYMFGIIFLLSGLYFLIKVNKNTKISLTVILLLLSSPIPDALTSDGNFSRASAMQPFIALISGLGLYYLFTTLSLLKNPYVKRIAVLTLVFIVSFSVISFYIRYTTYFKNNYSTFSQFGYRDLMTRVEKEKTNYEEIYVSRHLNDTKQYIYYLFFNKYNPAKYQSKKDVQYKYDSDGWVSIDSIENIYFIKNDSLLRRDVTKANKKILLIEHPNDIPDAIDYTFVIKDKLGNVIFKAITLSDLLEYDKNNKKLLDENIQL
ncbi:MAG: glycosyltransferase family 39 protein, partial [Actinobacteria bacterium]|nr:glycosyltransferase family 39 protein [Actinomycetota bacterium]